MREPLISVIVPVYKAEKYLKKCVDSIRNQTYQNLEIILVNDGSPDRCGEMCDTFAAEDSRIRVLHKANGGQSSARNLGLDNMTGEYVGFVDSDDWIEPDMYSRMYESIIRYNAQIACCGVQKQFSNGSTICFNVNWEHDSSVKVYSTAEALANSIWNEIITYSLCDKLFLSKIFSHLRMREGMIYEDQELIPQCIEQAETIVYDPRPFYQYRMLTDSTTHVDFALRHFLEGDIAYERARSYKIRYPALYDSALAYSVHVYLGKLAQSKNAAGCEHKRGEILCLLRGDLPGAAIRLLPKYDKLKFYALRISPLAFDLLFSLYNRFRRFKTANTK